LLVRSLNNTEAAYFRALVMGRRVMVSWRRISQKIIMLHQAGVGRGLGAKRGAEVKGTGCAASMRLHFD
jgi:hypothetical protein